MRYLGLIVESERTPESTRTEQQRAPTLLGSLMERAAIQAISFLRALWGEENFSSEETSSENEMSLVQYASLCGEKIVLTGDTGRNGLTEAAAYAPIAGLPLPGVDRIQVPHHGSRRNVSTAILDYWLGSRLATKPESGSQTFTAIVSAAKNDSDHPRKAVVRAFIHRGGKVFTTEENSLCSSLNAPNRPSWNPATQAEYPEEQEE